MEASLNYFSDLKLFWNKAWTRSFLQAEKMNSRLLRTSSIKIFCQPRPPASSWIVIFFRNEIHHESLARAIFIPKGEEKYIKIHKKKLSACANRIMEHSICLTLISISGNFLPSTCECSESKKLKLQGNLESTSNNKILK